jgi:hypothetical protein
MTTAANFHLWSTLSDFFFTSGGPVNGEDWATSNSADGGYPIWVDTYTPAATYVPGQSAQYTIVLTSQDWVGAQQPLITVATTTLIDPFGNTATAIGNLAGAATFTTSGDTGSGAVIYWQASATTGDYDVKFQPYTTTYVTAPSAGPNTTLTGSPTTLETAVANPTSWDFNYSSSELVFSYTTEATATTENIWFQAFNTSGAATSPLVDVAPGVADGTPYFVGYSSSAATFYYFYAVVNGSQTGMYRETFNTTTGALGTASELVSAPSFTSIFGIGSVGLPSSSALRFIEGMSGGQHVLESFLSGSSTPTATFDLTGSAGDHWSTTAVYDPGDGYSDYTVLAYADNSEIHLELLNASGVQIGSDFVVPGLTSFDRIHTLSNGTRVEIDYTVTDPSGGTEVEGYIYDTATSPFVYTLGSGGNGEYIGTPFNDTITDAAGTYFVAGGGGTDTFVVPFASNKVQLSVDSAGDVVVTSPDGTTTLEAFTTIQLSDGTVTINGNTLTELYTNGSETVSKFNITGQIFTSTVKTINSAGNVVSVLYGGVTGEPYTSFQYDYDGKNAGSGYNLVKSQFFYTEQASGLAEVDYDGGGNLLMASYNPTGAASWNYAEVDYVAGQLADSGYQFSGPGGSSYSSVTEVFNYASQFAYEVVDYSFSGQTYNSEEITVNAANVAIEADYSSYTGATPGATEIKVFYDPTSGAYAGEEVDYSGLSGAYTQVAVDYNAAGQVTEATYGGWTNGAKYSSLVQFYESGALQRSVFIYDQLAGKSINGQAYYGEDIMENAAGAVVGRNYDLVDGGDTLIGTQSGLNFPTLGGPQNTFNNPANGYAIQGGDFTITGGGNNETFTFAALFNQAEITDYGAALTAGAPDQISLSTTDFANWTALVGDASASGAGGVNTTFTSTTTGDKLTLDGVTVSQISAMSADFQFHA